MLLQPGGDPLILCFVDFVSPAHAATAMDALQGQSNIICLSNLVVFYQIACEYISDKICVHIKFLCMHN